MLRKFLLSEAGAITVDWTVLTAAAIGMSIGTVGIVQVAQTSLGQDIGNSLSNATVAVLRTVNAHTFGFDDGNFTGWSTTQIGYSDALGEFLGPFGGNDSSVTNWVGLPDGATEATVSFDLLMLNSWDGNNPNGVNDVRHGGRGDGIAFTVNGVEIGYSAMTINSAGNPTGTVEIDGTTYSYTMTRSQSGDLYRHPSGDAATWQDAVWSVEITATNPPAGGFLLGVNGTANQPVNDEGFGIDNYTVNVTAP